ncbi:unnamed protein product, partial [marine sediment metagenome]
GFNILYNYFKKYRKSISLVIVAALYILLFGVYMWPYWTGAIIYEGGEIKPSARVKIPEYYYKAANYINEEKGEFKILSLPHQTGGVAYDWEDGGYIGSGDIIVSLISKPILSPFDPDDEIVSPFLTVLFNLSNPLGLGDNMVKMLGLANIRYILIHNDVNYYINNPNPDLTVEKIKDILSSVKNINLEKSFGKLDFYKLNNDFFLPHIYIPTELIYTDKNIEDLQEVLGPNNYPLRSSVYFNSQVDNPNKNFLGNYSKSNDSPSILKFNSIPKITFVKINPTKYKVKVENTKEPYTLVFSESFNKGWKAYIYNQPSTINHQLYDNITASYFNEEIKEGTHKNVFLDINTFETLGKKPIPEDRHLIANGYANSWVIMPEDSKGLEDYEIIIEFWPQRLFYIGLTISTFTFLGCLCYLVYGLCMRKKRVKVKQVR